MRKALLWVYGVCVVVGVLGLGIILGVGYFAITLLFHVKPW
ncbi:MAG: hypothetical protein AB7U62_09355 [Pseudolabrys sp.]